MSRGFSAEIIDGIHIDLITGDIPEWFRPIWHQFDTDDETLL